MDVQASVVRTVEQGFADETGEVDDQGKVGRVSQKFFPENRVR
jgi:hypothetical protein